ncbi:FG-GAP-like repeat-containing protein [Streptomyces sp. NPDC096030]|uniref:FG-GAP-like repeat-containing protein n=1 Tax=Streptomyces sp. NPDC096030 TaxID=3155423 RepID=UPI00333004EF
MARTSNPRLPGNGRRTRAALALALATLTATASGITAPPAIADPASDVTVLPAAPRFSPRATSILNAGETGYLLAQEGDVRLQWIDYATGKATPLAVTLPEAPRYDYESGYWDRFQRLPLGDGGHWGDGSDTVAVYGATPAPHVTLQKGAGEVFADIAIPEGQTYVSTHGDTVLTRTGEADAPTGYHLLRSEGGTVKDTPVTGIPEGVVLGGVEDADATSLVLRYKDPDSTEGWQRWVLVDLSDGVAEPLPDRPTADGWEVEGFRLGAGTILRLRTGRYKVDVLDREAPGTVLRTMESSGGLLVGDNLLSVQGLSGNEYRGATLFREREEGTLPEVVLQHADDQVVLAPDGTALVAGAKTAEPQGDIDWAVHRISPTAVGGVEVRRLTTVEPMPARIYGLSLGSGILTTAENSTYFQPGDYMGVYRSTWLSPAGQPQPVRTTVDDLMSGDDGDCHSAQTGRCAVLWASGDGFHGRRDATYRDATMLYENGAKVWGPRVTTGMSSPELTGLSGRFGLVASATTSDRSDPYVVEFRKPDGGAVLERRTDAVAALWGSTLWSVAKDSKTVTSKTLPSGANGASFATRNQCVPTQLQAAGRWVYWSCDETDYGYGPGAGSGVYDRQTGRTMAVPGRNLGNVLLGDGYLVQQDAEAGLRLYDLHAGLPDSGSAADVPQRTMVSAADLGPENKARWGWTVDRFGGHVAYVGKDERVRIVRTGVPAPAVNVIDSVVSATTLDLATASPRWAGTWWTSKPTGAWQFTVTETATGDVVRTVSGAEARGRVEAAWDGKDAAGQVARNGSYTWTLTAKPADGVGADLSVKGSLTVSGGAPAPVKPLPAWRDFSGDGKGDLVALSAAGALTVRTGSGAGGLGTGASATGWPAMSMVVSFGDLSGDRCNDLLVRSSTGVLTRHDGGCGTAFAPGGPKLTIGSGWNIYNALTAPGDLTGDGRTDLLARTPAGELWMYADDGAGKFKGRVKLGGGWQIYNALVGTGDLNGDKAGDLLARDTAGVLWRYYGNGKGALGGRVKVGGGWQGYNALAGVGDITGDGRADLVARDTAGVLWRYNGTGAGAFAARVKIGGGWQTYKTLY